MTLTEWLQTTGTTQRALAARVGVSGVQISRVCTGRNRPSLELAKR
ncbi:MAG: helix-turn-helix domain-containing protein, partial [Pseudomonadota bacterium]